PRVLRALSAPVVGHLDPAFLQILNDIRELLQYTFRTENELTLAMSGTGSAGMETLFVNLIEPGDRVVVGVNGLFGQRMVEVAHRCGAEVAVVEAPWGQILDVEALGRAVAAAPTRMLALVHAETSTGVLQPLSQLGRLVREHDALLVVDTVTSLGGTAVEIDAWGIDAAYSGTQKCLSCPPGLAPVTLGARAREVLRRRKRPVQSWYLDLGMIEAYWGEDRFYHHTAPVSMLYALREALRLVHQEGLEARWERHARLSKALKAGLGAMGLDLFADAQHAAPMLITVKVPTGVDESAVRRHLLRHFGIEIGSGLGPVKGKIWRIGLMGESCRPAAVSLLLAALGSALRAQGYRADLGAALAAAEAAGLREEAPA
ncbi:MAG TPA: alanine--glyoxylate aminotransferase family protein, partial [Limnochordia bacterium]